MKENVELWRADAAGLCKNKCIFMIETGSLTEIINILDKHLQKDIHSK